MDCLDTVRPAPSIMTWQAARLLPQAPRKIWNERPVAACSKDFEPLTVVGQFNGLAGTSLRYVRKGSNTASGDVVIERRKEMLRPVVP